MWDICIKKDIHQLHSCLSLSYLPMDYCITTWRTLSLNNCHSRSSMNATLLQEAAERLEHWICNLEAARSSPHPPNASWICFQSSWVQSLTTLVNRVFSHDVMAAILVFQNNETAAMLMFQTNPVRVELFSYVNSFFCSHKFSQTLATWVKMLYCEISLFF